MENIKLISIDINDKNILWDIIKLSDKVFWEWFLSKEDLLKQIKLSKKWNMTNSLLLFENDKLLWHWICYLWWNWFNEGILISDKNLDLWETSYIKTIIIDPNFHWKWYWKIIIAKLIENSIFKWDKSIILHAWAESPNNSSVKFFKKSWAIIIKKYENRWYEDSLENWWLCSKCWNPCKCSSIEMQIKL
jgi:hypothetical protein